MILITPSQPRPQEEESNSLSSSSSKRRTVKSTGATEAIAQPPEIRWFASAVKVAQLLKQMVRGDGFPKQFIKDALQHASKQIVVEESPHPYVYCHASFLIHQELYTALYSLHMFHRYPSGVRVTSTVHI